MAAERQPGPGFRKLLNLGNIKAVHYFALEASITAG